MKQIDYKRLSKIIQQERDKILEQQTGLDLLDMDKSVDKAVLNNLSTILSKNDLQKVNCILSHYYDDSKGHVAHLQRQHTKIQLSKQIRKLRKKQKEGQKK